MFSVETLILSILEPISRMHVLSSPEFGKHNASPLDDNVLELHASDCDRSLAVHALRTKVLTPASYLMHFPSHLVKTNI